MRTEYKRIQEGLNTQNHFIEDETKAEDRIRQLTEIGFQWNKIPCQNEVFEKRCFELEAFKEDFGHCRVPKIYPANPSLGTWCISIKTTYNRIQKGMKIRALLPQDRIERLEKLGFPWRKRVGDNEKFEKRCCELIAFKEEFGHCNVPWNYPAGNPSLGKWCNTMRNAYKKIQKGSNHFPDSHQKGYCAW